MIVSSLDNPIYAMILSPQGRFLFDVFVIKDDEAYLLDIFEGTKDLLLKRLNLYKINQDVSIESLDGLKIYYSREKPNAKIFYKDPRYEKLMFRFISEETIDCDNSYNEDKYNYSISRWRNRHYIRQSNAP
ncbi:MAG UNVERIFIED_CONTAM: hypothetical protein LVQ98_02485 [Rickettsiaceae bacterium]|jgi:folate-binding Fe-S cluster repair protein YgfZ